MKKIISALRNEGRHFVFHCFAVACFLQGWFIIVTASDMGPVAPFLVAAGLHLVVFSLILEILYWATAGLRRLAARWALR